MHVAYPAVAATGRMLSNRPVMAAKTPRETPRKTKPAKSAPASRKRATTTPRAAVRGWLRTAAKLARAKS